ncbi:hypothetical protein JOQ06_016549 [Pogonophryne albipinna]|uniref:Uncharacterized protein n=1 Tax=Pogonophryne albipinna TaxID=1090488 RepID=A0AAD6F2J1_9TELE|nr:hypothetical protein JOQ06_016549 [Pogonophryne albipinna]
MNFGKPSLASQILRGIAFTHFTNTFNAQGRTCGSLIRVTFPVSWPPSVLLLDYSEEKPGAQLVICTDAQIPP